MIFILFGPFLYNISQLLLNLEGMFRSQNCDVMGENGLQIRNQDRQISRKQIVSFEAQKLCCAVQFMRY